MLEQLDVRINLRFHYSSREIDWLARLEEDASEEDFLEYYRDMIAVDAGSDITSLQIKAFDPETARETATTVIELSEQLVNRLSDRIITDTLRFARSEFALAEARVRQSSTAVTDFRKQTRLIDPTLETSAVLSIVTGLETRLAEARTELLEVESYMRPQSARIKVLRTRVAALAQQVENERHRLANESDTDLTRLLYGYEPLILEQKLAEQLYASALTSLEVARTEAQRKQRYLIPFVAPELPDEALEPERLWNVLTVFFGACLVYAIGGLVWSAINDHL
jgi:capsular polysaccharide transport system permease protein